MSKDLKDISNEELLAELEKRKSNNVDNSAFVKIAKKKDKVIVEPQWVGRFAHELPNQSQREKFAQYSTPSHIAEFCVKLANDCGKLDLKDQIVYEPFVGAGAMFLPLRNKGAMLVGSDIDLEALEICKQLVPEAILIHHDSIGCLEPNSNIKHFEKRIKEIKEKPSKNKRQIIKDNEEIERLEGKIEKEKLRTPWRWDLYCVEHLIQEPKETFLNLTRILRNKEIAEMRKEHNEGKEMFLACFSCGEKEVDYQICQDKEGNIICQKCYLKNRNEPKSL